MVVVAEGWYSTAQPGITIPLYTTVGGDGVARFGSYASDVNHLDDVDLAAAAAVLSGGSTMQCDVHTVQYSFLLLSSSGCDQPLLPR